MSNLNDSKSEDGLDETGNIDTIIGSDLDVLNGIALKEDEGDGDSSTPKPEGSTEGFSLQVDDKGKKVENGVPCVCMGGDSPNKPAIRRVKDEQGNHRITIILGYPEMSRFQGNVVSMLDSASENDVVDITILTGYSEGTLERRSVLSAINRCRARVITRAGALHTVGEIALFLSGDEWRMSPMGAIFLRQPVEWAVGDLKDAQDSYEASKESFKEYVDFIAEVGLFTKKDLMEMYENRSQIALFGKELFDRLATCKHLDN